MAIVYFQSVNPVVNCKMDYINSQTYNTYAKFCCFALWGPYISNALCCYGCLFYCSQLWKPLITSTCNRQIPSLERVYCYSCMQWAECHFALSSQWDWWGQSIKHYSLQVSEVHTWYGSITSLKTKAFKIWKIIHQTSVCFVKLSNYLKYWLISFHNNLIYCLAVTMMNHR